MVFPIESRQLSVSSLNLTGVGSGFEGSHSECTLRRTSPKTSSGSRSGSGRCKERGELMMSARGYSLQKIPKIAFIYRVTIQVV